MKYLQVLQSKSDIGNVDVPSVYYIKDTEEVLYFGDSFRPLTFVAREDDMTVSFTGTCAYSLDGSTWVDLPANTATPAINAGEKISFRKEVATLGSIGTFSANKTFDLEGNIMSMLFGANFIEKYNLTSASCFSALFYEAPVVDASKLSLPATNLTNNCYDMMFSDCTNLTQAPELPATNLTNSCYNKMFYNCTNLTQAPELPATTLESNCYNNMFCFCTNLTQAPELPATTLTNDCYYNMFFGCSNLIYIVMLATDISAANALYDWTRGVAASGTFVKAAGVEIPSGNSGIPNGWTVEER